MAALQTPPRLSDSVNLHRDLRRWQAQTGGDNANHEMLYVAQL